MLKGTLIAAAIAAVAAFATTAASAGTCASYAAGCMKNGGTKSVCYGPALAQCNKTGSYVGPYTGKVFQADIKVRR